MDIKTKMPSRWARDKDPEKDHVSGDEDVYLGKGGDAGRDSLLTHRVINGVDIDKALERLGGSEEVLVDVMRSYAANIPPSINKLREYLGAENLEDYAIGVHGIKGACYGISARKAGDAARALELAAKAGNLDAVKEGHPVFAEMVETLLGNIDRALAEIDAMIQRPPAPAPDPALLAELREACGAFDMDRVDKAMTRLESFQYENNGEIVAWLREQINKMTFEEISEGEWPSY